MSAPLQVDVLWAVPPDEDPDERALLELSDEEWARAGRFHFARDRREYLCAHRLLRTELARRLGAAPRALRFEAGRHGRPELAGAHAGALRFNLSHTRGLVAVAVAEGECELGLDVEDHTREGATVALADRYFAPAEAAALRALPESEQRARFFAQWTLKEAYIKARGLGLAMPLEQFAFELDEEDAVIGFSVESNAGDIASRWHFLRAAPTEAHTLAVAVAVGRRGSDAGEVPRYHLRRVD